MLSGSSWAIWLLWLLIAFFAVNSVVNAINPRPMRESYARWGFPSWFNFVNAGMEAAAAALLYFPETRLIGFAIGLVICLGIFATLIRHGEYSHMGPGLVLFAAICLTLWGLYG